jgi:hypothetical protein
LMMRMVWETKPGGRHQIYPAEKGRLLPSI